MKKIIIYISLLLLPFMYFGCSDYLDVSNAGQIGRASWRERVFLSVVAG